MGECMEQMGSFWDDFDFECRSVPSDNLAGELMCVWGKRNFQVSDLFSRAGYLGFRGRWKEKWESRVIVNISYSCQMERKKQLWGELQQLKTQFLDNWCLARDFNVVRKPVGRRNGEFNTFIDSMELLEIPLARRQYMWFKSGGSTCSKLDMFLLSPEWLNLIPDDMQVVLNHDVFTTA